MKIITLARLKRFWTKAKAYIDGKIPVVSDADLGTTAPDYNKDEAKTYAPSYDAVKRRFKHAEQQIVNVLNFAQKKDITDQFAITIGANWAKSWGIHKVLRQGNYYQIAIHMGFKCTAYTGYTVNHNPINIAFPAELVSALTAAGFGNMLYSIGIFNVSQTGVGKSEPLTFTLQKSGDSNVFQLIASKQQCVFNVNDIMNINVVFDFMA